MGSGSELAREDAIKAAANLAFQPSIVPMLRVGMPFWTLCVLFATQSVANCIATLEREER
ncbi:hypothetical protein AO069_01890 [Pseudomonas syringae pv. syringae PD2774]|nr:hypothetical protein AO069_01890 [Pseudomonas syringae pv. syringae PD2774]